MSTQGKEVPAEEVARMRSLLEQGMSKRNIARETGHSRRTVQKYLHGQKQKSA